MKRKYLKYILLIIITLLVGCKNKKNTEELVFSTDFVQIDATLLESNDRIGFSLPYAYRGIEGKEFDGKVISVEGSNINKEDITLVDEDLELINDVKYNNYKLDVLGVIISCGQREENYKIEKLIIEIYGMQKELVFNDPLEWHYTDDNSEELVSITYPSVIFNEKSYYMPFYITALEDVKILDCYFINGFEVDSVDYCINESKTVMNDMLTLTKGDHLEIDITGHIKEELLLSSQVLNFVVEYKNSENDIKKYIFVVSKQGISCQEDGEAAIELLVGSD